MSYTSGNKAPTLMAQAPNRHGNHSKHPAKHEGGVTAVTRPEGSVMHPPGTQGHAKTHGSVTEGRKQKVQVHRPECYDVTPRNNAYMNKSTKNYLG